MGFIDAGYCRELNHPSFMGGNGDSGESGHWPAMPSSWGLNPLSAEDYMEQRSE